MGFDHGHEGAEGLGTGVDLTTDTTDGFQFTIRLTAFESRESKAVSRVSSQVNP